MQEQSSSSVGATQTPLRFVGQTRQMALAVEESMLAARVQEYAAVLWDIVHPTDKQMEELPAMTWEPHPSRDNQPIITVGVCGGAQSSRGRCMLDTGSGFTLTTTHTCREHGLTIRPFHGAY